MTGGLDLVQYDAVLHGAARAESLEVHARLELQRRVEPLPVDVVCSGVPPFAFPGQLRAKLTAISSRPSPWYSSVLPPSIVMVVSFPLKVKP